MKTLTITSPEALDAAVADVVRLKIKLTELTAAKDAEVAAVEKQFILRSQNLVDRIAQGEREIQDFCEAERASLFADKKSRETTLAIIGFRETPPRVSTRRKVTWAEVVKRLLRLDWGAAYVRQAEPKPDKEALLADRERLTEPQQVAAGIEFVSDERFFIEPKPETAKDLGQ